MKVDSAELIKELSRLSKRLSEIVLYDFEDLDNVQLNWKAMPNQWSIAECLLHINLFFAHYLPIIQKELVKNKKQAQQRYRSGFLGDFLVKRVQLGDNHSLGRSLKSQAIFKPDSEEVLSGIDIIQDYQQHQKKLKMLLDAALLSNLESIRIPFAPLPFIRLRLGDLFRFIVFHNERHIVQAQRVRSEEQFPRTTNNEF